MTARGWAIALAIVSLIVSIIAIVLNIRLLRRS